MGKVRQPRDFEAHLIRHVYIDETSQNERFLVIGGIVLPRKYAMRFERAVIDARGTALALRHPDGSPREISWANVSNGSFAAYKNVVDAYLTFGAQMDATMQHTCKFYCTAIDTHVPKRIYTTGEKGKRSFSQAVFFHCLLLAQSHYKQHLFYVYPDDGQEHVTPRAFLDMLNGRMHSDGDKRDYPFRRVKPFKSIELQALQVSDILLGALAYRYNGHYEKPRATKDKKELSDYILGKAKVLDVVKRFGMKSTVGKNFTIHARKHPEVTSGPATPHPDRPERWRRKVA